MARVIIAGAAQAARDQLYRLLASSGYEVFRLCASGSELRWTLAECEDGVVIMAGRLTDALPDDIAFDFSESFQFLLIGRREALEACESPQIFKLNYPCSGSAVIGAIEMLSQLHYMRLPHREGEEKDLVEAAKSVLMQRYGIDEPEAHRRMQQYAMRHNLKMKDHALRILQGGSFDA